MKNLKVLELFGGIGACSNALKRLNIPFEIVDYVEIDKYAVKSFNAIYDTNFEPQDIITWNKDIEVDLIMHGSPCQDFSLAGKQAGGDKDSGTRSSLMYETLRIVEKLKPKYVIWENVKNILSQKHRHNFDSYLNKMSELGYTNYYQVLNAKDYGIPQNRERVFTVSVLNKITSAAMRGRNPNNPSDRTTGCPTEQRIEISNKEISNCITTVQKDNLVCEQIINFEFPPKQELKLKLKDILEDEIDEKYYLNDEMTKKIIYRPYIDKKEGVIRKYGIFDTKKSTHQAGSVYDSDGLSPTLTTMEGGWRQPCIENKIIKIDIPQTVRVRKYPVDIQKLVELLRKQKELTNLTNQKIANELKLPLTKVEHWFRTDNSFAIPDTEYWYKLKEMLNITTSEFDKPIMIFEEREGVYEKSNRYYYENGISPTLTNASANEKIITNLRIRKLTPKECWRLMGFSDEDFEKAKQVNSDTQLYKQAGNSIVVNVLVEIFKNLFKEAI